jgi:hypothetical protein
MRAFALSLAMTATAAAQQVVPYAGPTGSMPFLLEFDQSPTTVDAVRLTFSGSALATFYYLPPPAGFPVDVDGMFILVGDESEPFPGFPDFTNRSYVDMDAPGFGTVEALTYVGAAEPCHVPAFDNGICMRDLETSGTRTIETTDTGGWVGSGTVLISIVAQNYGAIQIGAASGASGVSGSFVQGTVTLEYITGAPDCTADVTGDGMVDLDDLLTVIMDWGCTGICQGDVNGDNVVDVVDLADLIREWGDC